MAPFFGNSVACRIAEAHEIKHSTLVLGDWRAAQRIEFYIGRDGGSEAGEEGEAVAAGEGQAKQRRAAKGRGSSSAGRLYSGDSNSGSEASGGSFGGPGEAGMGRSVVTGVGGFKVWVVNTHLDHEHQDNRQRQVGGVCRRVAGQGSSCHCLWSYAGVCMWHLHLQQVAASSSLCSLSSHQSTKPSRAAAGAAGAGSVRVDGQGEAGLRSHHPVW
jgi:hypothetical protein